MQKGSPMWLPFCIVDTESVLREEAGMVAVLVGGSGNAPLSHHHRHGRAIKVCSPCNTTTCAVEKCRSAGRLPPPLPEKAAGSGKILHTQDIHPHC
ncbi:hypothetical protein GJV26_23100 [Massilia dura]|uniref:Uncharacterized protein n=1 Tax=Pseudoduganella dura TaxID=321982 RepID=A0A6I3XPW2_9BURK|nr:hypothetical protein [Pseudoduganella dura]MUI15322.1 hypothetical protein [Pseudoduganella dura]